MNIPTILPKEQTTGHPVAHLIWKYFVLHAKITNISLDHIDDWYPHWECYRAGCIAGLTEISK